MGEGLKKKVGPLPLWGWLVVGGGTVGAVLLYKKSKEKKAEEPSAEVLEHLPAGVPEVGSAGGGGGGGTEKTPPIEALPARTEPSSSTGEPIAQFVQDQRELESQGWHFGTTAPPGGQAATGGTPGGTAAPFKTQQVNGHTAHVYPHAVPNGTGPGHNIVVLAGPTSKAKPHAKQPSHRHAAQRPKAKAPPPKRPKPPARHNVKRPAVKRK